MVTTVGTGTTLESLLEDLVQLDYDAAAAYEAAINRLQEARLREFKGDHLRHIAELGDILVEMGRTPPKEGDMKGLLTRGKVVIGGLMGDKAILRAMRTNEADTNIAYERAVAFHGLSTDTRDVLERGLADERRHCEWILEQLKTL
jgi:bacterioferritin (cytochrome b1)